MIEKIMFMIAVGDGAGRFRGDCVLRSVSTPLSMRQDLLHSAQCF
jgi:hypothetical protein